MKNQEARLDAVRASAFIYSALDALEAAMTQLEDYRNDEEAGAARSAYWMVYRKHDALAREYIALERQLEREGGDDNEA